MKSPVMQNRFSFNAQGYRHLQDPRALLYLPWVMGESIPVQHFSAFLILIVQLVIRFSMQPTL